MDAAYGREFQPGEALFSGCIGHRMALQQMRVVVREALARYRLEPGDGYSLVPEALFTLRPSAGVAVRLRPATAFAR